MKGSIIGLITGLSLVLCVGVVVGGIGRAAPCGMAPDFATGAFFGAFAYGAILGLPASAIGCVFGGVFGFVFNLLSGRSAINSDSDAKNKSSREDVW